MINNENNEIRNDSVIRRFLRYFNLGMVKNAKGPSDKLFPTRDAIDLNTGGKSRIREIFPPEVEKYYDRWLHSSHDDALSWKNRYDLWFDMDMLYFNCLSYTERMLSKEYGLVPIGELVNKEITAFTSKGWQSAEVKCFGKDILYDIHFKRRGFRKDRIVRATLNHRWRLIDGTFVATKDLKETTHKGFDSRSSNKIPYIEVQRPEVDMDSIDYIYGIRHGLVYGDGTTIKRCERNLGYQIRLCSDQEELIKYFEGHTIHYPPSFNGDPVIFMWDDFSKTHPLKELPSIDETDEYLTGFFRGWLAADGTVGGNGKVSLCCGIEEEKWLREIMPRIGIQFNSATHQKLKGHIQKFIRGKEIIGKKQLVTLRVNNISLKKEDLIIRRKRDRFREVEVPFWTFDHIDYESGKEEDIYCAIVPETQDFVLEDGLLTGNSALISRAIELIADEVIQADSHEQPISIEAKPEVKKFIQDFFDKINIYSHLRATAVDVVQYGNAGWILSFDEKGVDAILPINIYDFKDRLEFSSYRVKQLIANNDKFFTSYKSKIDRIDQLTQMIENNDNISSYFKEYLFGYIIGDYAIPPWRFLHFRNFTTKSPFKPFGIPVYIHAVAPYRQFDSAMTLQIAARGARLPIDVYKLHFPGTMAPTEKLNKAQEFISSWQNSGINAVNKEEVGIGTTVVTIADLFDYEQKISNIDLGKIDDIDLLRDELIIATQLPRSLLDPKEAGFGDSGIGLIERWKPFARLVYRIQQSLLQQISELVKIHMIYSNKFSLEDMDFILSMPYPESMTNNDMINNQKDLLDLSNQIMQSLADKLTGGDVTAIPIDVVKSIYSKFLPYDDKIIVKWLNDVEKQKNAMSNQNNFNNDNFQDQPSEEVPEEEVEKTKKQLLWEVALREKVGGKEKLFDFLDNFVYINKQKRLREGTLLNRHYYSSKIKNDSFPVELLQEIDKRIACNPEGKKQLKEEVKVKKYVFTYDNESKNQTRKFVEDVEKNEKLVDGLEEWEIDEEFDLDDNSEDDFENTNE